MRCRHPFGPCYAVVERWTSITSVRATCAIAMSSPRTGTFHDLISEHIGRGIGCFVWRNAATWRFPCLSFRSALNERVRVRSFEVCRSRCVSSLVIETAGITYCFSFWRTAPERSSIGTAVAARAPRSQLPVILEPKKGSARETILILRRTCKSGLVSGHC